MNSQQVIEAEAQYILGIYKRPSFVLERGMGATLYDKEGNAYLDFMAGIAVNALGYCVPELVSAMVEQATRLSHCSNLYHSESPVILAKLLVEHSFADKVFFCNSGAEAVEAALKFARKWAYQRGGEEKHQFITFENSFHGRTYGAISATAQPKYHRGFGPMLPGFHYLPLNDLAAVEQILSAAKTAAVLVEPVQGEGGIRLADAGFLAGLRRLCNEHQVLLIFDEIQCGMARTGKLFAYEHSGVEPDLMVLAKPLGGGLPIGVTLLRQKVAEVQEPGSHGSTFGANPVVCAVAVAVLNRLLADDFPAHVTTVGAYLLEKLRALQPHHAAIKEVRGVGLMVGVELADKAAGVVDACRERGLIVGTAGEKVLRLVPPLVIEPAQVDQAVTILDQALAAGQQAS